MDPPHPSFTVLRIKRKATEPPLSSLVIQDTPQTRFKKRRDISSRARGVFRLAETVPDTWQGEGDEAAFLQERIQGLLEARDEPELLPSPKTERLPKTETMPTAAPPPPQYQYRVVPPTSPRTKGLLLPPRVLTIAETDKSQNPLVFVDAHAVTSPPSSAGPSRRSSNGTGNALGARLKDDGEMEAFQSMLQEYLDFERPSLPPVLPVTSSQGKQIPPRPTTETEQYVYDLYFRDLRPSLSSTPLGLGAGDGVSIGALLGYEDLSPSSSPDASEPEDEADEDSNDEDFYRNDYPEDEDADEDMRGYRDAFSDEEERGGSGSEERAEWDYR